MDIIRNTETPYPLMLPTPATFSCEMSKFGLRPADAVVVYDAAEVGTYNAPRVAWMFRIFGHRNVYVLNNFRAYNEQGLPVQMGDVAGYCLSTGLGDEVTYPVSEIDQTKVVAYSDLQNLINQQDESYQIVDTRANALFTGREGYSDPSIQKGHIPGSVSIPMSTVLNEDGAVKAPSELRALFEQSRVSEKPVILTCNSGVTAATVEVALEESGYAMPKRIYDGSWMEWGKISSPDFIARGV